MSESSITTWRARMPDAFGPGPIQRGLRFLGLALFLLALAVLAVHTAVAKPFYIPSGSMLDTLRPGDRVLERLRFTRDDRCSVH